MPRDEATNPIGPEQRRLRHLGWEGCRNVRDLGGYPAMHGHATCWHAIVRADNLASLTAAGRAALVAYGVRSIIDLRRPHESVWESVAASPSHDEPCVPPGERLRT